LHILRVTDYDSTFHPTSTFSTTCFPNEQTLVEHVIVIFSFDSYLGCTKIQVNKTVMQRICHTARRLRINFIPPHCMSTVYSPSPQTLWLAGMLDYYGVLQTAQNSPRKKQKKWTPPYVQSESYELNIV